MILNVFKTCINAAPFLPVFQAMFLVLLTAQWRLRHTGSSGLARIFDHNLHRTTRVCFVYLWHHTRSHFTKLL